MKEVFKKTIGTISIILGLLALITPFSPGSWLMLIGLGMLGIRIGFKQEIISFLKQRKLGKWAQWLEKL